MESIRFDFPKSVRLAFTQGDCWKLAQAINEMTGYPVITAQWVTGDGSLWSHVANRLPDGRILDIEGVWGETGWLIYWQTLTNTYYDDEDDMVMFAREWSRLEFAREIELCGLTPHQPAVCDRVKDYARAMLDLI